MLFRSEDSLLARARVIDTVRVIGMMGNVISLDLRDRVTSRFVSIRRNILDTVLLSKAASLGVTVWTGIHVREIRKGEVWRIICTDDAEGDLLKSVECNYLVGADGRNSTVCRFLSSSRLREVKNHKSARV